MQIVEFEIQNFRSIRKATIDLSQSTILVGPNNEGKSNVLRALVCGMRALSSFAPEARALPANYRLGPGAITPLEYRRDTDLPIDLRDEPGASTKLTFLFQLFDDDRAAFRKDLGHTINQDLKVSLTFTSDKRHPDFKVIKRRSGTSLGKKPREIASFIAKRVAVEYIPAQRSASQAANEVQRLVAERLRELETTEKYVKAVQRVQALQRPTLDAISREVLQTVRAFMPQIAGVSIRLSDEQRLAAFRNAIEMIVDDGQPTSIDLKGDGVQSLAALALLRQAALSRGADRQVLVAIEEPEAHLHPQAIHQLKAVLADVAKHHQVVVTTHSPLLVSLNPASANVIVRANTATRAVDIRQVRDCLGVRLGDNLQSARLALVVEGPEDRRSLQAAISLLDPDLRGSLDAGDLVIEDLGGGTNLSYRLSQYASGVCTSFAFLDADSTGRGAVTKALEAQYLLEGDYLLAKMAGKDESEFEDLVASSTYLDALNEAFGVKLRAAELSRGKSKWSTRLSACLQAHGKLGSKTEVERAKQIVSNQVRQAAADPFDSRFGRVIIEELLDQLRKRLGFARR